MVLIGLGSNQGASLEIVPAAIRQLTRFAHAGSFLCSRLWQTSPVDCPPDAGVFINAVVAFNAIEGLTPENLLIELKTMERGFGRGRSSVRNAPRELDLDLLVFDDQTRDGEAFTLPHPRAVDRLFVLAPAAEIVPELKWPGIGSTVQELLIALQTDEQVAPLQGHTAAHST